MKEKDTKRTSFDLSIENSDNLGKFSDKMGSSYSRVINYMLRIFLKMNPEVKDSLFDFCNTKVEEITENMAIMSEFEKQDAEQQRRQYQELAYFFAEGQTPKKKDTNNMRKIYLYEGYLLIPDSEDWVLLDNFTTPDSCRYAGVVETRQPMDGSKKYKTKHYVYFSDYQYSSEYPQGMSDRIYTACCEKNPAFKEILNSVVTPKYKEGAPRTVGNMINLEAYKAAPCPGLFHIVVQGDPTYWNKENPNYEPAFGCVIVREEGK